MKRNTDNMEIKRRSTFAILFYINRTKIRKDGTCQLLCKISIDAKWEQIGTKVSVNPPDFITFLRHHIAHNDNQRVT